MKDTEGKTNSILVIRSAPLSRTFEALRKLHEEYPNAEISILIQPEVKDEIEKSGFVDKVIVGKSGRVGLLKYLSMIFRLRRERFDLLTIIYNTENIVWYSNVRLFTLLIRAKERVGITIMNTFKPFSIREIIFKDLILIFLSFMIIVIPLFLIFVVLLSLASTLYHLKRGLEQFKSCLKGN